MRLALHFLLLFTSVLKFSALAADNELSELSCELSTTEWEPINGNHLLTCDIFTQAIDLPGFKINLGANADEFDKIEGLRFNENENIKFLPEGIADTFPNLQGLIGVQTYLTVINGNDLKGLRKLKYLNLAKSDLKVIEEGVFSDLISLTELDLSDADIRFIHENAFQGLSSLKTLYLGANKLTQLEPNSFSVLTSLESISLEFNHLEAIDDNLFASNTNLADIWLNSNKITMMQWKVFQNLKSLSYVDVQDNPCIDGVYDTSNFDDLKDSLMNCTETEKINDVQDEKSLIVTMRKLPIRKEIRIDGSIDDGSFSQYMKIVRASDKSEKIIQPFENDPLTKIIDCKMRELYWRLSDKELSTCEVENQIIDAKDFEFVGSENSIKAISFDGNKNIKYLPNNIGKFSPNLVEFSTAKSSLMLISDKNFAGLRHLRSLNLANSNIRYIDPDAFDDLISLQELDFSGNELEKIDEELFEKLKNLRVLRIGSNRLHIVHPKLFRSLRNLVSISMSHQYISKIDENIFKTNVKLQEIFLNSNKLKSISPNMFNNLKVLEYVDIRDNKCIDTVYDQPTFSDMKIEILTKCGLGYELKMGKKAEVVGRKKPKKKSNKKQKKKKEKLPKFVVEEQKEVICEYDDVFWSHANRKLRTCIISESVDDPDYFLSANPILFETFEDTDKVEAISFVNNKNIKYLPKNIAEVFPNLIEMSAANSGLIEITFNNFKDMKNLKSLNLAGNEISTLPGNVFEDLTSLEELNIDYNQISTIDTTTFKYLKFLRKLHVRGNKFGTIENEWFEDLSELHDITFDVDELLLNWDIFSRNPKLKWISMNGKYYNNKMEIIEDPEAVWESPFGDKIEETTLINVEFKEIECVYDDDEICNITTTEIIDSNYYAIKDSPQNSQIKKFVITNNKNIKFFPQNLGASFPILESIEIQNTGLHTIKKKNFNNLPLLESLIMNSNKIKSFKSDIFDELYFLKELDLGGNKMEILEEGIFKNTKRLQKINLGSNDLHYIHPKSFKFLKKLREVDLSENKFSVIDETLFKFNPNLEEVKLNGNKIEHFSPKTFEFSIKLRSVDMSGNNCIDGIFNESTMAQLREILIKNCEPSSKILINEVYCDLNEDDKILKHCIISNQPIEEEGYIISIDPDVMEREKVEILRISNNPLINYLPGNAGDVFPNLLHFNASYNSLEHLPENVFHSLSKLRTLDLSNNKLKELDPETFNDLSSLEEINLSGNKIGLIVDSTFIKMPNLRKIDLSGNDISYVTPNAFSKLPHLKVVIVATGEDEVFDDVEMDDVDIRIVKNKKKFESNVDYDESLGNAVVETIQQQPEKATLMPDNEIDCILQRTWSPRNVNVITSCVIVGEILNDDYHVKPKYQNDKIEEMRIENNTNVHYLPYEFRYSFPKLKSVVVKNVSLKEIPENAFENLKELTEIDLSGNKLKEIPPKIFKDLEKVELIDLSDNEFVELPTDFFWYLPSLKFINLSGNKFSELDPEMFKRLPRLRKLSIAGNNFDKDFYERFRKRFPAIIIFNDTTKTTKEIIEENSDELICKNEHPVGSCVIENQPIFKRNRRIKFYSYNDKIEELVISDDNDVQYLPYEFRFSFPKLRRLKAKNLNIREIPKDAFDNLEDLKEIDLSGNKLKQLDPTVFKNLPKLEILDLSDNDIEEISLEIPSLKKLNLKRNKIKKLDPEIIKKIPNLEEIFIDNDIDREALKKINPNLIINNEEEPIEEMKENNQSKEIKPKEPIDKNLKYTTNKTESLILNKELTCKTEYIPWSSDDPRGIISCNLVNQPIYEQDYKIKSSPTNDYVEELKIENNKNVHYLPEKFNKNFPKLGRVIARNLSLDEIPSDIFEDLINLSEIDLSGNKLKSINPELLQNLPSLVELNLNDNQIEKIPEEIFKKTPSLKKINLNNNKIRKIDPKIFEYLLNLNELSLLGNNIVEIDVENILRWRPKLKVFYENIEETPEVTKSTSEKIENLIETTENILFSLIEEKSTLRVAAIEIESTASPEVINSIQKIYTSRDKNGNDILSNIIDITEYPDNNQNILNFPTTLTPDNLENQSKISTEIVSKGTSENSIFATTKISIVNVENTTKMEESTPKNEQKSPDIKTTSKPLKKQSNTLKKKNRKGRRRTTTSTTAKPLKEVSCDTVYKYSNYFDDSLVTCNLAYKSIDDPEVAIAHSPFADHIEAMNFDNNPNIKFLPEKIAEKLPNLREISGKKSAIESLLPGDLENLKKLENIDLSGNTLHFIEPEIFTNLPSLKSLDLSGNEIEFIHEDAFENVPSLKDLKLSENSITYLDPKMFEKLPELEVLNIEGNDIPTMSEEMFKKNPRLKDLKHSLHSTTTQASRGEISSTERHSQIKSTTEKIVHQESQYVDITTQRDLYRSQTTIPTTTQSNDISEREIECDYGNIYSSYSDSELFICDLSAVVIDDPNVVIKQTPRNRRVRGLRITDNKEVKHLPKNIGEFFPNLYELTTYNTSIKEIPRNALKNLKKLKFLNLMHGNIEIMDPKAFKDLYSLENIDLSFNKINKLHPKIFQNNPYIKSLYLANNDLNKIDPNLLVNLPELRNISLESNNISSINRKTFEKNYDLQNVWLERNKIRSIDPTTFDGKRRLEYVDLRGNECIDEIFEGRTIENMKRKFKDNCPFDERTLTNAIGDDYYPLVYTTKKPLENYTYQTTAAPQKISTPNTTLRTTSIYNENRRRPTKPRVHTTTTVPTKVVTCEYLSDNWPNIACIIKNQPIDDRAFTINSSPHDPYITELIINDNKDVKFLPENISKFFPNLEKINAKNNSLIEVFPTVLKNLSRLKSLDLSDNNLSILDPEIFETVPLLEDVDISGNHMPFLINETFTKSPRIKKLDISRNEITELNQELFKSLPELEIISLNNNEIFDIPEKVFQKNLKLKKIDLSGNKLKSINPEIFENLPNLRDVNLNENDCINGAYKEGSLNALKIDLRRRCTPASHYLVEDRDEVDTVDPYNYGPSWGVEKLKINEPFSEEYNEIDIGNQLRNVDKSTIECNIIEEFSAIERNNVKTCKIGRDKKIKSHWKIEDSPRTKRVKRFVVDGNDDMQTLPNNLVEAFPELLELDITNTPLKEIQPEKLKNLNKLKSLKLPKNSIKYLDSNTFEGVPNLQNLYVNDNSLRHIDENAFKNLHYLNNLDLSGNKLPKVSKEILKHLPELKTINLSNNDLNHVDFDLFKKNPKLYSIDLSANNIKSIDPEAFDRLQALFNIDLSKNECIDRKFSASSHPLILKSIISEHCQPLKILKLQLKSCQKFVENCKQETPKPIDIKLNNDQEKEILKNNLSKSEIELRRLNLQLKNLQSELMHEKELRRIENEKLHYFEDEVKRLRKKCARIDESHNFLVDIECEFIESFDGYSCVAKNLLVSFENSTIENIIGNHKREKRNSDVTSLTIKNQSTKFLPNEIQIFFPNLRKLKVENSKLSKLSKLPFKSLPNLTHLTISKNHIKQIDPNTFDGLSHLESIDLSQNYIEKLPQKVFEVLPNLKKLNLANNMLTALPQDIIPKVNNLEKILANNNQFDFIDPRALKKLRKAEVIDLRNGKCIDENYVKSEGGDIVRLIGKISLHCINDDELSGDSFCMGRKLL